MNRDSPLLTWIMIPAAFVLAGLLAVALMRLRPGHAAVPKTHSGQKLPPLPRAAEETRELLGWLRAPEWHPFTNASNPFFTLAIQPAPAPAPPPAAPTTRRIDVTYRGFLETSAGIRRAVVQVADKEVLGGRGDKIVADYAIMEIEVGRLTLTNTAGKSVTCAFTKTQSVEVAAQ